MSEPVYIIGAGRTDFKRNFKKEGKTIRHIIVEAAQAAIAGLHGTAHAGRVLTVQAAQPGAPPSVSSRSWW